MFNEVLYYSRDPIYLLRKYAQFLFQDGKIIISIYQKPEILTLQTRLLHCLNPRRPISNLHCTGWFPSSSPANDGSSKLTIWLRDAGAYGRLGRFRAKAHSMVQH